jgi:F-type H+-transporting ATPase subunit epsilon
MTDTFDFKLVSPEKMIFSDQVSMVVIPGLEGDFGVLSHHAALISTLRPGLIHIYRAGALLHRIYVATGFANVNEKGCTVLAQDCLFLQELDKTNLEATIREKLEELDNARSEERREALCRDLYFANIKLQIIAKNLDV